MRRSPARFSAFLSATAVAVASGSLVALAAGPAAADDRPHLGDAAHGVTLIKEGGGTLRVDGEWINRYPDEAILKLLQNGKEGFPEIDSDNILDNWDVIAALREKNTNLSELVDLDATTHVYVAETELDDKARSRLTDQGKLKGNDLTDKRRVFVAYAVDGEKPGSPDFVTRQQSRKRDALKKNFKKAYVVFVKLPGFRGGAYEAAFAIDPDIKILDVVIRDNKGDAPADLNSIANRLKGKGARGRYDAVRAGGPGKAATELQGPLSDAFLMAAEAIYMFELDERDYFAFD